jgi:hypothetical protein
MTKREFYVLRDKSGVARFGLCTRCNQQFLPLGEIWGQIEDFLRRKFDEHICDPMRSEVASAAPGHSV